MNFKIRRATASDIDLVQELFRLTVSTLCQKDYTDVQIAAWLAAAQGNLPQWIRKLDQQYFLLAMDGPQLLGFGSVDGGYIDFMYAHPDYAGRGVASGILRELESEASRNGHQVLHSDVSITARPFFEKKGFKVLHANENIRGEENLVNYRMEKHLS